MEDGVSLVIVTIKNCSSSFLWRINGDYDDDNGDDDDDGEGDGDDDDDDEGDGGGGEVARSPSIGALFAHHARHCCVCTL